MWRGRWPAVVIGNDSSMAQALCKQAKRGSNERSTENSIFRSAEWIHLPVAVRDQAPPRARKSIKLKGVYPRCGVFPPPGGESHDELSRQVFERLPGRGEKRLRADGSPRGSLHP